jgi:hypothetical protein
MGLHEIKKLLHNKRNGLKLKRSPMEWCPATNEWIKKMWYLYTMEFFQPQRRMKFCQSHVNG